MASQRTFASRQQIDYVRRLIHKRSININSIPPYYRSTFNRIIRHPYKPMKITDLESLLTEIYRIIKA